MIDLIDYGGGNIGSVQRCLERLGVAYQLVNQHHVPTGKNPLIFPGVGAFGASMCQLVKGDFAEQLRTVIQSGVPYLGICIGLQTLFASSEESPDIAGLGLIPGKVIKYKAKTTQQKIPQIGWNYIESPLGEPVAPSGYVYFVNSYYAEPDNDADILYISDYEGSFCAGVRHDNITGFQFHPEKSGAFGQSLVQNWLTKEARHAV